MSVQLKQFVGSIINTYLGPFKRSKLICDGEDCIAVKCPLLLLKNITIKDPFCSLLEDAMEAHHHQFGCSTTTLLAMWYLWHTHLHATLQEGCELQAVIEYSQVILDDVVSKLSEIAFKSDKMFTSSQQNIKSIFTSSQKQQSFSDKKTLTKSALVKSHCYTKPTSSHRYVKIGYSSRHFSPSTPEFEENKSQCQKYPKISVDHLRKKEMLSFITKLCHGETDFVNLICDLWTEQVESENNMK